MTQIHDMTAGELLAAYKSKKLSPVEAIDAVIARIEAWEPKLKALYAPDFGSARKAARIFERVEVPTLRHIDPAMIIAYIHIFADVRG